MSALGTVGKAAFTCQAALALIEVAGRRACPRSQGGGKAFLPPWPSLSRGQPSESPSVGSSPVQTGHLLPVSPGAP